MQLLKSNIKRKISRKSKKSRKNKRNVIKTRKTRNSLKSMKNKVLRDINKNLKLKMKGGAMAIEGVEVNDTSALKTLNLVKTNLMDDEVSNKKYPVVPAAAGQPDIDLFFGTITSYKQRVQELNNTLPELYKKYNNYIQYATLAALKISAVSTLISKVPMDP